MRGLKAGGRQTHWDLAALALREPLLAEIQSGDRVLEVGAGDLCIISLFLARHRPNAFFTAVDVNPDFVQNARETVRHNGFPVAMHRSDLFGATEGPFDAIIAVLPYVPSGWDKVHSRWFTNPEPNCVSDGGPDGLDLIRRALAEAPRVLAPDGRLLLATSDFYHTREQVLILLDGWRIAREWRGRLNPTRLWVLVPRP